jgi:hypothetical protein
MDDRTEREILARLDYIERYLAQLGGSGSGPGNLGPEPFQGPEWSDDGPGQPFPAAAGGVGGYSAAGAVGGYSAASGVGGYSAAGGMDGYNAADWVESDIVALARSGRMIEAIKMYRQRTGADLKQAKAAVEQAARGY